MPFILVSFECSGWLINTSGLWWLKSMLSRYSDNSSNFWIEGLIWPRCGLDYTRALHQKSEPAGHLYIYDVSLHTYSSIDNAVISVYMTEISWKLVCLTVEAHGEVVANELFGRIVMRTTAYIEGHRQKRIVKSGDVHSFSSGGLVNAQSSHAFYSFFSRQLQQLQRQPTHKSVLVGVI